MESVINKVRLYSSLWALVIEAYKVFLFRWRKRDLRIFNFLLFLLWLLGDFYGLICYLESIRLLCKECGPCWYLWSFFACNKFLTFFFLFPSKEWRNFWSQSSRLCCGMGLWERKKDDLFFPWEKRSFKWNLLKVLRILFTIISSGWREEALLVLGIEDMRMW